MGPRLISRGNGRRQRRDTSVKSGFNGAATDQSRKYPDGGGIWRQRRASMGPRLISRGNL